MIVLAFTSRTLRSLMNFWRFSIALYNVHEGADAVKNERVSLDGWFEFISAHILAYVFTQNSFVVMVYHVGVVLSYVSVSVSG